MLPVKPVLETQPTERATAKVPLEKLPFSSSSSPTSPKTRELKARYEAAHATEPQQDPKKVGLP